ncbi:MAG: hypothetical protein ACI867_000014 [Glaciecola sp.]
MSSVRIAAIGAVLVLGTVAAVSVTRLRDDASHNVTPEEPSALIVPDDDAALMAGVCRRVFVDFTDQIARDAPAADVLRDLRETLALARAGADRGADSVLLLGGVGALIEGISSDDPAAADIAIRVLADECARVQAP